MISLDNIEKLKKEFSDWYAKNAQLELRVKALDERYDPVDNILAFLLVVQLIEFELMQLMYVIRYALVFEGLIHRNKDRQKLPRWYSENSTFGGQLKIDFQEYKKIKTYKFMNKIDDLIYNKDTGICKLRNEYIHRLYFMFLSSKDVGNLAKSRMQDCYMALNLIRRTGENLMKLTKDI